MHSKKSKQRNAYILASCLILVLLFGAYTYIGFSMDDFVRRRETGTDGKSGENIDTEGQASPEIIVDTGKLADLPKPDQEPKSSDEAKDELNEVLSGTSEAIPEKINLDVPFFAQAPDGDRTLPWKEACEEASIVLGAHFLNDEKLTIGEFKEDILAITRLEEEMFGSYIDTTIEQTAQVYEKFYGIGKTKIIDNPSIDDLKRELSQGHPIVAPFAGRELGNSHFTNGGPRYHMLVIRGYDKKYFFTNDVGTRFGENFPYTYKIIMDAMHDFTTEEITSGAKRVLVLMQ